MSSVTVDITPIFHAGVGRLLSILSGDAMNAPLTASGWVIANAAKEKCPVLTGTLRRSIGVFMPDETARNERGQYVRTVLVGSGVPYAARIEYGFEGPDKLGRVYHQRAQPYLRPALDENQRQAQDVLGEMTEAILQGNF